MTKTNEKTEVRSTAVNADGNAAENTVVNAATEFIMCPSVDVCFKNLMTNERVRQGFIAAVLHIPPEEITETKLLPTIMEPEYPEDKLGIVDVRVKLADGRQLDLEMQAVPFTKWEERTLFYMCRLYTEQIKKGEKYDKLKKCIHIGILDYNLYPDRPEFYSCFHISEDTRGTLYTDKFEFHVLELPKLRNKENPEGVLEQWMKFLGGRRKEDFEAMAEQNEFIDEAYQALMKLSADERKRLEYEYRQMALYDYNTQMGAAEERGEKKGKAEAILELLEDYGTVSDEMKTQILAERDLAVLKRWLKSAARATSMEEFSNNM